MSDLTAAQADRLAAIEAAPDAPESLRRRVAEAMWDVDRAKYGGPAWPRLGEPYWSDWLRCADAALRVITEDARS